MPHDPYIRDLLGNQRRSRSRRPFRRLLPLVLVLSIIALAAWHFAPRFLAEAPKKQAIDSTQLALTDAASRVRASITAAERPIRVEALEPETDAGGVQAITKWEEGKPASLEGTLQKNESVFLALQNRGLSNGSIHAVVAKTGELFNFRYSRPGDRWSAEIDAEGTITRFRYQTSPEEIYESARDEQGTYHCEQVEVPIQTEVEVASGMITASLWQALEGAGLSANLVYQFMDIFSHEIDFNAETQPGDQFRVLFEKVFLDGEFLRDGRILAAEYTTNEGKVLRAFFYHSEDDESGYYDEKGQNLQRQFLKSPLANVRMTSRFGRRFHPILKRWKMHAGVDYAAPTGTPVMAVAKGTVSFAGRKGANGKLVSIRHARGYETHYAHLSRISKGIKRGTKVDKKTLVGRVGSTGRSTGPHLHFGMKKNGKFVNPLKVDFMRAEPLKGRELERFLEDVVAERIAQIDEATGVTPPQPTELGVALPDTIESKRDLN